MERNTRAAWTWGIALIPGLAGSILFYNIVTQPVANMGPGFPLFVAILIAATLAAANITGVVLSRRTLWLLVPMLFFAVMVAVRAEQLMMWLNIGAVLALGGLALHYLPLKRYPDQASTIEHIGAMIASGFSAVFGPLLEMGWLSNWFRTRKWELAGTPLAVVRGLALAVPILIVFGVLLASADEVFSKSLGHFFSIFSLNGLDSVLGRGFLMAAFTWGATGIIAWGVRPIVEAAPVKADSEENTEAAAESDADTPLRKQPAGFRLGMIETGIVMGAVNLLFAFFVLIQFTYLFGGQRIIEGGMTYSAYARRGFFELVAVTVLVLTLGRVLDAITARRTHGENRLFRGLCITISALTLVILASAWHRMFLYEEAYGFTHLRLYTHVFMLALAALLGFFLAEVFRLRPAIFSLGVLLVAIGYLVILNALNVELFIAERNIDRYRQGLDLDACYLVTFSVDALPAMQALYEESAARGDDTTRAIVNDWMGERYRFGSYYGQTESFLDRNLSIAQAQQVLENIPAEQRDKWNDGADNIMRCRYGYD